MAATARYWRAIGLQSYDGQTLDISEFQLMYLGVRMDAGATMTSNIAPDAGSLSALQDGVATSTATWLGGSASRLVISWDMGTPITVDDIRVGSGASGSQFLLGCGLQYSSTGLAGSWTELFTCKNIWCIGSNVLSTSPPTCLWDPLGTWSNGGSIGATTIDETRSTMTGTTVSTSLRAATPQNAGVLQFEVDVAFVTANSTFLIGVQLQATASSQNPNQNSGSSGWAYAPGGSIKLVNGVQTGSYGGTVVGANSTATVGVVIDFTAGSITFYKNGTSLGVAYTGQTFTTGLGVVPIVSNAGSGINATAIIRTSNFNYPVGGASPWDQSTRIFTLWKSVAAGVQAPFDSIGYGPYEPNYVAPITPSVPGGPLLPFFVDIPSGQAYGNFLTDNTVPIPSFGDITGLVTVAGAPAKRLVRIIRDIDGACFGEEWSDPVTGAVTFYGLSKAWTYTGIAYDYTGTYQALVWNSVAPV